MDWVLVWWTQLSCVAALNIVLWFVSARRFSRQFVEESVQRVRRHRHLVLSGIYTFVCAFRSFMPRADVQRICLVDSWWSTVLVGRTVATIAEVSFVAQWAALLREYGEDAKSDFAVALSKILVPLICFAETCSWYAVLSTNYLGNSCEESTWGVTATLMTLGMVTLWPRATGPAKRFLTVAVAVSVGYVLFMANVDVPMYLGRWHADSLAHRPYFSIPDGLHDLATRWVPTRRFSDWHQEMPWMSLYFSFAVWASLYMTWAPRWQGRSES